MRQLLKTIQKTWGERRIQSTTELSRTAKAILKNIPQRDHSTTHPSKPIKPSQNQETNPTLERQSLSTNLLTPKRPTKLCPPDTLSKPQELYNVGTSDPRGHMQSRALQISSRLIHISTEGKELLAVRLLVFQKTIILKKTFKKKHLQSTGSFPADGLEKTTTSR